MLDASSQSPTSGGPKPSPSVWAKLRSVGLPLLASTGFVGLLASVLFFSPFNFSFFDELKSQPKLALSTLHLDLGDGRPNQVMSGEIRLKNTGSAPLEFTISTSCGCQDASPRKGTIAPGDELPLSLTVRLPDYSGAEKAVYVVVHSNDPDRREVRCAIVARAPAPFEVNPAFIDFGRVNRDEVASLSANVHVTLPDGETRAVQARLKGASFLASFNEPEQVQIM